MPGDSVDKPQNPKKTLTEIHQEEQEALRKEESERAQKSLAKTMAGLFKSKGAVSKANPVSTAQEQMTPKQIEEAQKPIQDIILKVEALQQFYENINRSKLDNKEKNSSVLGPLISFYAKHKTEFKHTKDINNLILDIKNRVKEMQTGLATIMPTPMEINKKIIDYYGRIATTLRVQFEKGINDKKSGGNEESFVKYLNDHPNESHYFREIGIILKDMYVTLRKEDPKNSQHYDLNNLITLSDPHKAAFTAAIQTVQQGRLASQPEFQNPEKHVPK